MVAHVSSIVRVLAARKEEDDGGKRDLVTRDLLGGGGGAVLVGSATAVDSERPAAAGCDRRLDFLYGKRSCSSPAAHHHRELQDLNLPPSTALNLHLVPLPASPATAAVCTLERVKLALERAERESRGKQRRSEGGHSTSPSSSTTTSSAKKRGAGDDCEESSSSGGSGGGGGGGMMAAGCPQCLLYVLISKSEPRCPRCDSYVPVPVLSKRPRIDLNFAQD